MSTTETGLHVQSTLRGKLHGRTIWIATEHAAGLIRRLMTLQGNEIQELIYFPSQGMGAAFPVGAGDAALQGFWQAD